MAEESRMSKWQGIIVYLYGGGVRRDFRDADTTEVDARGALLVYEKGRVVGDFLRHEWTNYEIQPPQD